MKIYISGKISGRPLQEAMKHFEEAEEFLKDKYKNFEAEIINPFKLPHLEAKNLEMQKALSNFRLKILDEEIWRAYMKEDVAEIFKCSALYMLKDWGSSKGARVEYAIAKELGLTFEYE